MKNNLPLQLFVIGLVFSLVISCRKDNTDTSAYLPPCTTCAARDSEKSYTDVQTIEIDSVDWIPQLNGSVRCDLLAKVTALFPWDYGTYKFPLVGFDYGISTQQIMKQGDSLTRYGGVFFFKGYDFFFQSQTAAPPNLISLTIWIEEE